MPLTRMKDDYIISDGVKFWMADKGRPVLCRVTHEALRDHADRVRFNVADEKVFEAYRLACLAVAARTRPTLPHQRHQSQVHPRA